MRDAMSKEKLAASTVLDAARQGDDVPASAIAWALAVLGDLED